MRSKAPLVMMEQLVMVLVFALTAALCVQIFVLSEKLSIKASATDRASLMAQNVAERMKADEPMLFLEASDATKMSQGVWRLTFDENWNVSKDENAAYYMEICFEKEEVLFWSAIITVFAQDGTELFSVPVAAQRAGGKEDA